MTEALDGRSTGQTIERREDGPDKHSREEEMTEQLFNLTAPGRPTLDGVAEVRPNLWLLSSEDLPPLLFSVEQAARLLEVSRDKVFALIRARQLRSVKVGGSRRISARALSDFVADLERGEPS